MMARWLSTRIRTTTMGSKSNKSQQMYNNKIKSYSISSVFQKTNQAIIEKTNKLSALSNTSPSLLSPKNC